MLGLTGALVTALVASGLAVAAPAVAQPRAAAPTPAKPVAEASNTAAAVQAAVTQKSPVAVADLTTETRAVHAQPDGTLKAVLSPRAVRTKQGKSWVDVDTTMVRRADGTVGPKATTVELALSGGGAKAPLVRFGKNGKRISLSWPGKLPEPTLDGSIATYAEVLPGVDLAVRAEPDGYVEHLVIKTAEAAKNPALAKIRLGMTTEGVSLRNKPDGGLDATDAKGTVVFTAPPAAMWDAKDTAKESDAKATEAPAAKAPGAKGLSPDQPAKAGKQLDTPGAGARRATAKFAVEKQALTVIPDQALLTNPATTFPVVVDPDWHTPGRIGWAKVFSGYPNDEYWNGGGDGGEGKSGLCNFSGCNGIGVAWTYFQYDTGFLAGKRILSASLNTTVIRSPSCNWRNHEAYLTDRQIDGGTNWNNRPGGAAHLDTKNVDVVYSGCDGYKGVGFNVGGWIRGGGISTYLIKAAGRGRRPGLAQVRTDRHQPRRQLQHRAEHPVRAEHRRSAAGTVQVVRRQAVLRRRVDPAPDQDQRPRERRGPPDLGRLPQRGQGDPGLGTVSGFGCVLQHGRGPARPARPGDRVVRQGQRRPRRRRLRPWPRSVHGGPRRSGQEAERQRRGLPG